MVLELASGIGQHTYKIILTGARVVTTDISFHSLKVLKKWVERVETSVADMESLPFKENTFNVVVSAGSLSYGKPELVDSEIRRVLRPGGIFICVDSLNYNPIYRLNRWLHYKRGERTKSTLLYMPTIKRIKSIIRGFNSYEIRFFGSVSYLTPMLARIIGQYNAARVSDIIDRLVCVRH